MSKSVSVVIACRSDVGMVRTENQDHFGVAQSDDPAETKRAGSLIVVADGMGGHTGGTVASHVTVDTTLETFAKTKQTTMRGIVGESIESANLAVRTKAEGDPSIRDMGTTVVTMLVRGTEVVIGHLGDSRCYLMRDGALEQVTRDHTYLNELIDMGLLTAEQAESHPDRNIITRCVGMAETLDIDFNRRALHKDDRFLICSDGLTNMVKDDEIRDLTLQHEPGDAAERLIKLANERGGDDNITVAIIHIVELPEADPKLLEADLKIAAEIDRKAGNDTTRVASNAATPAAQPLAEDLEVTKRDITSEVEALRSENTTEENIAPTEEDEDSGNSQGSSRPTWFWVIGIEIIVLIGLKIWISGL